MSTTNNKKTKTINKDNFRKIDIEAFDSDNDIGEDDEQLVKGNKLHSDQNVTGPSESEVVGLLNKKRAIEALNVVLSQAPIYSKDQKVKVIN